MNPRIAIVGSNALVNIGLKSLLERIIPMAQVCVFADMEALSRESAEEFFHYFVAAQTFAADSRFFLDRLHKTILLCASEQMRLPAAIHTINIMQDEQSLVRDLLRLHQSAHRGGYPAPHALRQERSAILSERECDVLRELVAGKINKEIADTLHISINTVITHRRNITVKLGTRSVSALTIYAVTHGIADVESV